jgi:prophage antirepressor-like protein
MHISIVGLKHLINVDLIVSSYRLNIMESSTALLSFSFTEANSVRVHVINGEPWFHAADVCRVLGLTNPSQSISVLDADMKTTLRISEGGPQHNFINESAGYQLIFRSSKPIAKEFRRWICNDVISSIRKTGKYDVTPNNRKIEAEQAQLRIQAAHLALTHCQRNAHLVRLAEEALVDHLSGNVSKKAKTETFLDLTTIMQRMGIATETIEKQRTRIGKIVARRYRESRGREPERVNKYVNGAHRDVKAYFEEDYNDITRWIGEEIEPEW